jgi:acyl-CoA reductase-like NAD-dependent aldehyde dehydrogenase
MVGKGERLLNAPSHRADDQQARFGGLKHSGVGREFGIYRIEAFFEPKTILE